MAGVQGDLSMPPEPQPGPPPALPQGAGAVPQAPQGPQYDFSPGDALRKAAGDPLAQADAMSAERRAVLNPLMNDVQQAGARQQQHSQARQQQLAHNPQSPEPQQGMGLDAAANWVMIATGIGALAGAMTRRSATNAMAAFTGALEGIAAGNKQAFEQNKTIWEQENKRINQQLEQQRDAYLDIMNSDKMDLNMKMLMLQQKAAELHDDQTMQLAARKDMELWAERADKLEIARQQGVIEFKKIDATLARYGGGSDESIDLRVERALAGDPAAERGIRAGTPEYTRYNEKLSQRLKEEGLTARDLAQRKQTYNAQNRAESGFGTGSQGNTLRSISVADSHLQVLDELGKALGNGNVQAINRFRNAWKEQTGQEAPADFNAVKQIVGAEIIKAVAASGGGVPERLEAGKQIDGARSPQAMSGVINSYRRLLAGQRAGYRDQYRQSTGKDDFDTRFPVPAGMSDSAGAGAGAPGGSQIIKYDAQGNRI